MKHFISLLVVLAMGAAVLGGLGCKKSGGDSETSSGGGGGGGGTTTANPGAAAARVMRLASSGATPGYTPSSVSPTWTRPLTTVSNYNLNCPGGGTINVDGSGAAYTISGDVLTFTGAIGVTLNNCVSDSYTFNGSWSETFNYTDTFLPNIASPTSVNWVGTVAVTGATITVSGNGLSSTSCALTLSQTVNITIPLTGPTPPSGTVTYSGSACGQSHSGSCTLSGGACT